MYRSENSRDNYQPNRFDAEEPSPSPMSQEHTHVSTTPSPYVTAAALEDVKNSIQELRSILLHSRGGVLDREPNELETDQRGRDSRRSGVIAGEINDDTASIGVPRLPTPPPPPPASIIIADPSHRRRGQVVRVQSPRALEPIVIHAASSRSSSRSQTYVPHEPVVYQTETRYSRRTDATGRELDSVISDFSSIVIIATFLASVSIVMLELARNVYDSPDLPKSSLNKAFNIVLQVFASLALSFNLSVAIVAGGAASSQSLRLRLGQRASDFSRSQSLDTKLQLCSTLQYYGLLCLTISTACVFALLLNSPYAVLMIIPVVGVVFYDSLFRGKVSSSSLDY